MGHKSALDKLQETVVDTARGVAKDPIGTAKGAIALGRTVVGQVTGQVTRTLRDRVGGGSPPAPKAPGPVPTPEPVKSAEVTPADVARVVEKKPAAKKAPAKKAPPRKKAPAKKATPSDKLPPKKKAPEQTVPEKKAASEAPTTAAELLEDPELPSPIESIGTSAASDPEKG
jgi:hypothetical protein